MFFNLKLPVTDRTLSEVLLDPQNILVRLEISVHPELHLAEAEPWRYLTSSRNNSLIFGGNIWHSKQPDDDPGNAADDEEDVPVPQDEVDLVHDDVQAKDAECVQ